jgi:hypothetical protein
MLVLSCLNEIYMKTEELPHPTTVTERWLGAVPMFLVFLVIAQTAAYGQLLMDAARNYQTKLSLTTRVTAYWYQNVGHLYFIWMPAMLGCAWVYFAWASKSRRRMIWFNIASTAAFILVVLLLLGAPMLPIIDIKNQLRKK